jgi:hypothetical protein
MKENLNTKSTLENDFFSIGVNFVISAKNQLDNILTIRKKRVTSVSHRLLADEGSELKSNFLLKILF